MHMSRGSSAAQRKSRSVRSAGQSKYQDHKQWIGWVMDEKRRRKVIRIGSS
jgi:hypothetical protein